jgi:hypothetical protein
MTTAAYDREIPDKVAMLAATVVLRLNQMAQPIPLLVQAWATTLQILKDHRTLGIEGVNVAWLANYVATSTGCKHNVVNVLISEAIRNGDLVQLRPEPDSFFQPPKVALCSSRYVQR